MLSFLTNLWPNVAGIAAAVLGLGGVIAWLLSKARAGGKAEARAEVSGAGLEALKRMQQAEAKGPRDRDAVIKKLDEGKF